MVGQFKVIYMGSQYTPARLSHAYDSPWCNRSLGVCHRMSKLRWEQTELGRHYKLFLADNTLFYDNKNMVL